MAKKTTAATTGAGAATKLAVAAAAVGNQARSQATDARDRIAPVVGPAIGDARDRIAPVVGPVIEEARERLVDLTGTVATRIDEVTGEVSDRLVDLTGAVATRIDDALPDRVTPAVIAARVEASKSPNRLRQAGVVLGLGAVAAFVANRLTGGGAEPVWRSASQQPSASTGTPAGAPATEGSTPTAESAAGAAAAAAAGESAHGLLAGNDHASGNVPGSASNDAGETGPGTGSGTGPDTGSDTGTLETALPSVDVAGGTPEEVAADAIDTPHPVTTPDEPAQKVVLD